MVRFAENQPAVGTYTLAARWPCAWLRLCRNRLYLSRAGENKGVVFSGDFGAPHAPLLMSPTRAKILMLENTYGDRLHEDRASRPQRLEAGIEHALKDQRTVLIPAFRIGRTQELLYGPEEIIRG